MGRSYTTCSKTPPYGNVVFGGITLVLFWFRLIMWKATHLLEGMEEVWVTFTNEENGEEVTIEVCSVEDLVRHFIGDQDEIAQQAHMALIEQGE